MSRLHRSPKRPTRFPKFPYRGLWLTPEEKAGEIGELVQDCWSGDWFPKLYAVDGPFGTVDGRNGGTNDRDVPFHEVPITMRGPMRPPIT